MRRSTWGICDPDASPIPLFVLDLGALQQQQQQQCGTQGEQGAVEQHTGVTHIVTDRGLAEEGQCAADSNCNNAEGGWNGQQACQHEGDMLHAAPWQLIPLGQGRFAALALMPGAGALEAGDGYGVCLAHPVQGPEEDTGSGPQGAPGTGDGGEVAERAASSHANDTQLTAAPVRHPEAAEVELCDVTVQLPRHFSSGGRAEAASGPSTSLGQPGTEGGLAVYEMPCQVSGSCPPPPSNQGGQVSRQTWVAAGVEQSSSAGAEMGGVRALHAQHVRDEHFAV